MPRRPRGSARAAAHRARRSSGRGPRGPCPDPGRPTAGTARRHPLGHVRAGHGQDLRRHLLANPLPGRSGGAGRRHACQSDCPDREHKYLTRTLFSFSINVHDNCDPTTQEAPMTTTSTPIAPSNPPAHYKEPDWFTRHILNSLIKGLTRLGVSVVGLPGPRAPGPHHGQVAPRPGEPPDDRGAAVPGRPPGRDAVGSQRAPRRRAPGADPRAAAPAVTATEIPVADSVPMLRAYLRRWKFEVGDVLRWRHARLHRRRVGGRGGLITRCSRSSEGPGCRRTIQ